MKKTTNIILICLAVAVLVFILLNAALPAAVSERESGWARRFLEPLLDFVESDSVPSACYALGRALPGRLRDLAARAAEFWKWKVSYLPSVILVRKIAHFLEYMALGLAACLFLRRPSGRGRLLAPAAVCLAVALADEAIQRFSDGRISQLRDVGVDMAGAAVGILLALLVLAVIRLFRKRQEDVGKNS